jgi:hypothetical protein
MLTLKEILNLPWDKPPSYYIPPSLPTEEHTMPTTDPVTKPSHYQFNKPCNEARDVIKDRLKKYVENDGEFLEVLSDYSNAIKYLLRWFDKDGLQDLKKARECIDQMIATIKNG